MGIIILMINVAIFNITGIWNAHTGKTMAKLLRHTLLFSKQLAPVYTVEAKF